MTHRRLVDHVIESVLLDADLWYPGPIELREAFARVAIDRIDVSAIETIVILDVEADGWQPRRLKITLEDVVV